MNWIGIIGGAIVIVTFLGTAAQYLRGSKDKGTIATLESSNQSLLEWQGIATKQIADLKADLTRANQRIDHLERENADLRLVRPSADVLTDLSHRLDAHDATMKELGEKIVSKLESVPGGGP